MEDTVLHAIALLRDLEAVCSSDSLDSDTVTSLPVRCFTQHPIESTADLSDV